ncbi:MAG: hypothetical protein Q8R17_01480 [bacterium]|nr:hypothetical protein [bacterium]
MKTILIPISNGAAARSFLRSDFARIFSTPHTRFVLLAPQEKLSYYRMQFAVPSITWALLPPVSATREERAWQFAERASMPTSTSYWMHRFYFERRGTKAPLLARIAGFSVRMLLWSLGHFSWYRALFRFAYYARRTSPFAKLLSEYKPDIVFCPTLVYGGEYALLKEAKRRGIKTVAMAAGWDNFTSKTFLRVQPDHLLVQTEIMKRDAMHYADYPAARMTVVGAPQYDGHIRRAGVVSREPFFKKIGADIRKKLIVFAFSGKVSEEADWNALEVLADGFRRGALSRAEAQVLVRPYPKRKWSRAQAARVREEFGFLMEAPVARVGEGKDAWEFDDAALAFLRNTLAHADAVISACSTFFVEAAIFGKPLVAIGFDAGARSSANSARRFFLWNHLADLGKTGGVARAESADDFIATVRAALSFPTQQQEGRARIAREQCFFTDGKSAERLFLCVCKQFLL